MCLSFYGGAPAPGAPVVPTPLYATVAIYRAHGVYALQSSSLIWHSLYCYRW